ncbi:MAG: hypothetical protein LQ338_004317 [Usnochroma carphineum]|nr:MAG: hypothetical protein LQ338_004317 [Usnochroma carphineum]
MASSGQSTTGDSEKEIRALKRQVKQSDVQADELKLRVKQLDLRAEELEELVEQKDEALKALESSRGSAPAAGESNLTDVDELTVHLQESRDMVATLQEDNLRWQQVAQGQQAVIAKARKDMHVAAQAYGMIRTDLSNAPQLPSSTTGQAMQQPTPQSEGKKAEHHPEALKTSEPKGGPTPPPEVTKEEHQPEALETSEPKDGPTPPPEVTKEEHQPEALETSEPKDGPTPPPEVKKEEHQPEALKTSKPKDGPTAEPEIKNVATTLRRKPKTRRPFDPVAARTLMRPQESLTGSRTISTSAPTKSQGSESPTTEAEMPQLTAEQSRNTSSGSQPQARSEDLGGSTAKALPPAASQDQGRSTSESGGSFEKQEPPSYAAAAAKAVPSSRKLTDDEIMADILAKRAREGPQPVSSIFDSDDEKRSGVDSGIPTKPASHETPKPELSKSTTSPAQSETGLSGSHERPLSPAPSYQAEEPSSLDTPKPVIPAESSQIVPEPPSPTEGPTNQPQSISEGDLQRDCFDWADEPEEEIHGQSRAWPPRSLTSGQVESEGSSGAFGAPSYLRPHQWKYDSKDDRGEAIRQMPTWRHDQNK